MSIADVDVVSIGGNRNRAFGSSALQAKGKIFAILVNDRLVVKLPKHRVAEFIASGVGTPLRQHVAA